MLVKLVTARNRNGLGQVGSRMNREVHVRFDGSGEGKLLPATLLDRVRQVARKDKDARFTALLHHADVVRLRSA